MSEKVLAGIFIKDFEIVCCYADTNKQILKTRLWEHSNDTGFNADFDIMRIYDETGNIVWDYAMAGI